MFFCLIVSVLSLYTVSEVKMDINMLCNGTAQTPAAHYIIPRGMVYSRCTNGTCTVVRLTVALERTLVTVDYEDLKEELVHYP